MAKSPATSATPAKPAPKSPPTPSKPAPKPATPKGATKPATESNGKSKPAPAPKATPTAPKSKPPVDDTEPTEVTDEEVTEVEGEATEQVDASQEQAPDELPEPIDRSEIKYPKIVTVNKTEDGEGSLTPDELKEIVGFTNDPITAKVNGFDAPLDTLPDNTKVWFLYNTKNRPYNSNLAHSYAQSMLTGKWEPNGEAASIGKTGEILSLQHRGMGLLIAECERQKNPAAWQHLWGDGPITIPMILSFGVDETDRVVNSIDTGKTRTGSDMLFRTEIMTQAFPSATDRKMAGNIVTNAVRKLWDRMGLKDKDTSYTPQLNQSELYDFIVRHPKIVEAAAHILSQDQYDDKKRGRVAKYLAPGYAAAALFLMGVSDTDDETYKAKAESDHYVPPSQEKMDTGKWDKACKFWSDLCDENKTTLMGVRNALEQLKDKFLGRGLPEGMSLPKDEDGKEIEVDPAAYVEGCHVSDDERFLVLANAWNIYKKGKPVKQDEILPDPDMVKFDKDRRRKIVGEMPTFGGVDVPRTVKDTTAVAEEPEEGTEGEGDGEATEPAVEQTPQQQINFLRMQFGLEESDVAIFKSGGSENYRLWNPNSKDKELMKALGFNASKPEEKDGAFAGLTRQEFPPDKLDPVVSKALVAGRKVYLIQTYGKDRPPECTPLTGAPPKAGPAKPKPAPKK